MLVKKLRSMRLTWYWYPWTLVRPSLLHPILLFIIYLPTQQVFNSTSEWNVSNINSSEFQRFFLIFQERTYNCTLHAIRFSTDIFVLQSYIITIITLFSWCTFTMHLLIFNVYYQIHLIFFCQASLIRNKNHICFCYAIHVICTPSLCPTFWFAFGMPWYPFWENFTFWK